MVCRREEKQKCKGAFWPCVALVLIASGCGQQPPPDTRAADESAIRNLDAQWAKTAAANDLDGTVSYYSDDATVLPPNAPLAQDKQAIRAVWAGMLGLGDSVSWHPTKVEVSRSGDLAYVMGAYQMTSTDAAGKPAADRGKFVEIWKKQADGGWKTVADIFNSDLPAQAPAPAKAESLRHHPVKKGHARRRHHAAAQ